MQIDFLTNGLAALQYKIRVPPVMRYLLLSSTMVTLLHALAYTVVGAVLVGYSRPSAAALEYGIVFLVQCPIYAVLLAKSFHWWYTKDLTSRIHHWVDEHNRNMVLATNLTVITGVANLTFKYAPSLTGALWISQEVAVFVWCWWKTKAIRNNLVAAALVARRLKASDFVEVKGGKLVPVAPRTSVVSVLASASVKDELPGRDERRRSSAAVAPMEPATAPGVVQPSSKQRVKPVYFAPE